MPPDAILFAPNGPKALVARLWEAQGVAPIDGATDLIAIDRVLLHDRTGSLALQRLAAAGRRAIDPSQAHWVVHQQPDI